MLDIDKDVKHECDDQHKKSVLTQMRQCCCPGSFARLNPVSNDKMHQMIGTCCPSDRSMPKEMREKLSRSKNSREQVVVLLECQSARTSSAHVRSLRQRELVNMEEHIRIEEALHVSNNNLGSACFDHHTDDMLSGKYDCLGSSNVF